MISLGEVLRNVPDSGTAPQVVEQIDIDLIESDPANFYQLTGIDELAANIELMGLQQPIVVKSHPEDPARVMIVSGHRRRAAIAKLVADGREDLRRVPCLRQKEVGSPALQELALIYANSDTRTLTSAEISKQAERVEELLYRLKEEGMEFPGRMRDHVAEACKVSKSKLSRLKVIREKLIKQWRPSWEMGRLAESAAYALAQMPEDHQYLIWQRQKKYKTDPDDITEARAVQLHQWMEEIDELECFEDCGGPCTNRGPMKANIAMTATSFQAPPCSDCCMECDRIGSCPNACPIAKEAKKKKQDEVKKKAGSFDKQVKEYQAEMADEDARFFVLMEEHGFDWLIYHLGDTKYRREGIEKLKDEYGRSHAGGGFSDFDIKCDLTGIEVSAPGKGQNKPIARTWTEAWDIMAVIALNRAAKGELTKDDDKPTLATWIPMSCPPAKPGQSALVKVKLEDGMGDVQIKARWGSDGQWHMKNNATLESEALAWWPIPEDLA